MSWSTCITCGSVMRDYDSSEYTSPKQPGVLPDHDGQDDRPCPAPFGTFTWNNGKNYWDDDVMEYRACEDGGEPIETVYGPRRPSWRQR